MPYKDDLEAARVKLERAEERVQELEHENARLRSSNASMAKRLEDLPAAPASKSFPADAELRPPPRSVPRSLLLALLFPPSHLLVLFVVEIAALIAFHGHPLRAFLAVTVALAAVTWRRTRLPSLLRHGVAAPATILSTKPTGSIESSSGGLFARGWNVETHSYEGEPILDTRLRLGPADGLHADFTRRGKEYTGGMFVYDPANPKRHVFVMEVPMPLRPAASGEWDATQVPAGRVAFAVLGVATTVAALALPILAS